MKKLIALLLALMMVLVCTVTLAYGDDMPDMPDGTKDDGTNESTEGGEGDEGGDEVLDTASWKSTKFVFSEGGFGKQFSVSGTSETVFPKEELAFTVTADESNPDSTSISVAGYTAEALTGNLEVTIPEYSKVGVYKYKIEETAGIAQGVTYSTTDVALTVLVTYDYENKKLLATPILAKNTKGEKATVFENAYQVGKLTVSKTVSGNMGKKDQSFEIKVTLTAQNGKKVYSDISLSDNTKIAGNWEGSKEIEFTLKDSESFTISDIPAGVSYTVEEASKHAAEDPNGSDGSKGYTVTYNDKKEAATGEIAGSAASVAIKNDKNIEIETGVALDFVPYMIILALALAGVVMLKVRRREDY